MAAKRPAPQMGRRNEGARQEIGARAGGVVQRLHVKIPGGFVCAAVVGASREGGGRRGTGKARHAEEVGSRTGKPLGTAREAGGSIPKFRDQRNAKSDCLSQ